MKMHDLLVYELTERKQLVKIVRTSAYDYQLEESLIFPATEDSGSLGNPQILTPISGTPDIIVTLEEKGRLPVVIEIEGDIDFDFAESLRQIKKYRRRYEDVRVIIPKICEKFAPIYKHEKIRAYLWSATRIWECIQCGNIAEKNITREPNCKSCGSTMRLDIKNVNFKEFE